MFGNFIELNQVKASDTTTATLNICPIKRFTISPPYIYES